MAVASGEGPAHDLTPLDRREAWGEWRENSGTGTVASETEEAKTTVMEKRRTKANSLVVLTTGIL